MGRFLVVASALLFVSSSGFALGSMPARAGALTHLCPEGPTDYTQLGFKDDQEFQAFLTANAVKKISYIHEDNLVQFAFEVQKLPSKPELYLARNGGEFRIIEGSGVGLDPEMAIFNKDTFDGRAWDDVPGAGNEHTHIAVNHLFDHHGSVNLILHERAHTLDILGLPGHRNHFSTDPAWTNIIKTDGDFMMVMAKVCGDYCLDNPNEAFAESFAMYFACPASRDYLKDAPRVMEYMKKFTDGTYFH